MAVIFVPDFTLNFFALVVPKLTPVTPEKFLPFMVTLVPVFAEIGEKDLIMGLLKAL